MPLKSSRFAGDSTLEACGAGTSRLTIGSRGPSVAKVQQALMDLNVSVAGLTADAAFGPITASAVRKFQSSRGLAPVDGIVGRITMTALDDAFPASVDPSPPGVDPPPQSIPVGAHWGVDTAAPANFAVRNRKGALTTLFELVAEELRMPEFWGRYLFGSSGLGVTALSRAEADFIRERSGGQCRILLIANIAASRFSQGRDVGRADANGALSRCAALGVTRTATVYADIEPQFQCNAGWFQGWWDQMLAAGRGRGGLYVEPGQITFSKPHRAALRATLDIFNRALNPDPPFFLPDPPQAARLLWSQRPLRFFKSNIDRNNFIPSSYAPNEPTYQKGMTAIWQYAGNCPVLPTSRATIIDMNLANDQGLASMWAP